MMQFPQNGHQKSKTRLGERPFDLSVPILGQPAATPTKWVCPRNPGHTYTGEAPMVAFSLNPAAPVVAGRTQFIVAQGVCLACVAEDLRGRFPVYEEGAVMPPAQGGTA